MEAYLAVEFVAADSLDIVVRDNGPAPVAHALQVAAQLAGAIDYAAAVGISHGALHPRDVLVSTDDTRLTGFGVAQAMERIGIAVPVRRPYAAPERIDNQKWGREADVFALAAISHELLTGRRIAGAGTDAADALASVDGIDVELASAVFARALAIDPALRFETALQFVDALKQTIDESVVAQREPKRARRRTEEEPRLPLDEQPAATAPAIAPVPPVSTFDPAELDIASAEDERYRDVESAPAVVPDVADLPLAAAAPVPELERPIARPPVEMPADAAMTERPTPSVVPNPRAPEHSPVSALERSRSAMWPLVLALLVGLALGFAAGYGFGTRPIPAPVAIGAPSQARDSSERSLPQSASPEDAAAAAAEQALTASPRPDVPAPQSTTPTDGQRAPAAPAPSAPAVTSGALPGPAASSAERGAAPARSAERAKAAPAGEPDAAGRILVRSTPAGAQVWVDGRERGRTPVAVRDLGPGVHHVRVAHDGYETTERRIVLSARRPSQSLQLALGRVPAREAPTQAAAETFVGALAVESRPSGAKVYLDGKLVGTTPTEVPGVSAGSHVVRLEHDGYRRWSSAVRVVSGERNRVTASLEK